MSNNSITAVERGGTNMSTKLLRSVTDEKADIQKQIGCMNGIFQLLGRATSNNHKRLPPGIFLSCQ